MSTARIRLVGALLCTLFVAACGSSASSSSQTSAASAGSSTSSAATTVAASGSPNLSGVTLRIGDQAGTGPKRLSAPPAS
jgi:hypothetical protein